jgi:hypothetical protein
VATPRRPNVRGSIRRRGGAQQYVRRAEKGRISLRAAGECPRGPANDRFGSLLAAVEVSANVCSGYPASPKPPFRLRPDRAVRRMSGFDLCRPEADGPEATLCSRSRRRVFCPLRRRSAVPVNDSHGREAAGAAHRVATSSLLSVSRQHAVAEGVKPHHPVVV